MSGVKICPQCESQYAAEVRFCPSDGTTLRSSESGGDLIGQVIADRYVVLEKLGAGGMGQVYLAEHVRMGRRSALKVMHPGMVNDPDAIARFNREASNASRISHPNVAAIYDFGETGEGLIYLAMEYVEGEPLTALIERQGALPISRALAIAAQVADALAAAHEMGIVHRDLKPDNIMIGRGRDGADTVKVVDFGIAKSTGGGSQRVTRTGYIVGTPEYMSPEQLAGDQLDGRSDIYALGLVTFNMLTGALPFPSATVQESMIMRLTERPRTLAEVHGAVAWPAALQQVLDRALEREAPKRFAEAHELARELLRAAENLPDSTMAEAGTLLIEAPVPRTRVAPAEPRAERASAGPAAIATRGLGTSGITGSTRANTTASQRRSRSPLVFVGIVVMIALAGTAAWAVGRGGVSDAATPAGGRPLAVDDSRDDGAEHGLGEDSAMRTEPAAVELYRRRDSAAAPGRPVASPAGGTVGVGPANEGTSSEGAEIDAARPSSSPPSGVAATTHLPEAVQFDPRPELDALGRLIGSFTASSARETLQRVDALLPRLANRGDSVEALYRRVEAHATLNDTEKACSVLSQIRGPSDLLLARGRPGMGIEPLHQQLACR